MQHDITRRRERDEEYSQERYVGPPEGLRPETEGRQDRRSRHVQLHAVLQRYCLINMIFEDDQGQAGTDLELLELEVAKFIDHESLVGCVEERDGMQPLKPRHDLVTIDKETSEQQAAEIHERSGSPRSDMRRT